MKSVSMSNNTYIRMLLFVCECDIKIYKNVFRYLNSFIVNVCLKKYIKNQFI